MPRNLVISVVGDQSVHRSWLAGPTTPQFDLGLVYFGDARGQWSGDAKFYLRRKGVKFRLLYDLFQDEWAHLIDRYDRFWIPDDDVAADTGTVNRLFSIAADYALQISQPAIGRGDSSYAALRAHDGYRLRYTQFVEMMCPLFTRKSLVRVLPLFAANASAWGIDWVWSSLYGEEEVAVIDAATVHHTRPVQAGGVHKRFAAMGVDPGAEYEQIVAQYRLDNLRHARAIFRDTARLRGIDATGREVWTCSRFDQWLGRRAA